MLGGCGMTAGRESTTTVNADSRAAGDTSPALVSEGMRVFRFDTFGDEQVWTDALRLDEVIEKNVDPRSLGYTAEQQRDLVSI